MNFAFKNYCLPSLLKFHDKECVDNITCTCLQLENASTFKDLGVTLDDNLSRVKHIYIHSKYLSRVKYLLCISDVYLYQKYIINENQQFENLISFKTSAILMF